MGRLSQISDALGNTTDYQYDSNDNLLNQYMPAASGGGQVHVEYTYDLLNRRTGHIQHKASGNLSVSYDYDETGNLVYIQDAKGQAFINVYDDLNRVQEQQFPAGGVCQRSCRKSPGAWATPPTTSTTPTDDYNYQGSWCPGKLPWGAFGFPFNLDSLMRESQQQKRLRG